MKKAILNLLQGLPPEVQRVLKGLEQEGELRAGFMEELVKELATERLALARSMMSCLPVRAPVTASLADVRNAVSRAYYSCHHGCRAALMVKFRLDYRGHGTVIDKMERWAASEAAWTSVHSTLKDLIKRRHLADYDPFETGSDGLLTPSPQPLPSTLIAELHTRAASVVLAVEAYLRATATIP